MTEENRLRNAVAEFRKARHALSAADALIAARLYDDAVSRLYYAVFHMASAGLLSVDVEVKAHAALQSLFAQHVVRPGLVGPDASAPSGGAVRSAAPGGLQPPLRDR